MFKSFPLSLIPAVWHRTSIFYLDLDRGCHLFLIRHYESLDTRFPLNSLYKEKKRIIVGDRWVMGDR